VCTANRPQFAPPQGTVVLPDTCTIQLRSLPADLDIRGDAFTYLWNLHPLEYACLPRGGGVPMPRWQQAYEHDYPYSGQIAVARPLPPVLEPLFAWVKANIDNRLNAVLTNWYDLSLGHSIGKHHDNTREMLLGSPIVTVSFGVSRPYRLRLPNRAGYIDISTKPGLVIVTPWETNKKWTHEVPPTKTPGRRISITFRCFK
jgi:alkylated DNA repair dioxygenase AlkB